MGCLLGQAMQQERTEGVVTATASATDVELVAQELARQMGRLGRYGGEFGGCAERGN